MFAYDNIYYAIGNYTLVVTVREFRHEVKFQIMNKQFRPVFEISEPGRKTFANRFANPEGTRLDDIVVHINKKVSMLKFNDETLLIHRYDYDRINKYCKFQHDFSA